MTIVKSNWIRFILISRINKVLVSVICSKSKPEADNSGYHEKPNSIIIFVLLDIERLEQRKYKQLWRTQYPKTESFL